MVAQILDVLPHALKEDENEYEGSDCKPSESRDVWFSFIVAFRGLFLLSKERRTLHVLAAGHYHPAHYEKMEETLEEESPPLLGYCSALLAW